MTRNPQNLYRAERPDYQEPAKHIGNDRIDYQELRDTRRNPSKEQRHDSTLSREEIREIFESGRIATEQIFQDIYQFKRWMYWSGPHADPFKVLLEMQAERRKQRRLEELWEDQTRQRLAWIDANWDHILADADAYVAERQAKLDQSSV